MTAIETRFHGATNHRVARISARFNKHKVFVSMSYDVETRVGHDLAVLKMLSKLRMLYDNKNIPIVEVNEWIVTETFDNRGFVYSPLIKGITERLSNKGGK